MNLEEKFWKFLSSIIVILMLISIIQLDIYKAEGSGFPSGGPSDSDGDGRPDVFEEVQGLDSSENDIKWTFLVYCCGDDVPAGSAVGTILPEIWEFIERLTWVGCTDNITIVVQFDGSDQLNGNHQDLYWNDIPNNREKDPIEGSTTRRFLVGKDTRGWDTSIILDRDCTNNTLVDLYDVTDWDPKGTGLSKDATSWEANMADPRTFHDFISWGMDTFPADNHCLYIDSHGDGIHGFGYDHRPDLSPTSTEKDLLDLEDIEKVADLMSGDGQPRRLDMVMLQSCLMGNIEFCTEFAPFSRYYVASENLMHITGNQDDRVLERLEENPHWSPKRLAVEFIDKEYHYSRDGISNPPWNIMEWLGKERLTFSCINNSILTSEDLTRDISRFNSALVNATIKDPISLIPMLERSLSESSTDRYTNNLGYTQIDLFHFLEYWKGASRNGTGDLATTGELSGRIMERLWKVGKGTRAIEYEKHDLEYFFHTSGIAIYFPLDTDEWGFAKNYYGNSSFVTSTGWDSVIDLCFRNFAPAAEDVDRITSYVGEKVTRSFNVSDINGDRFDISVLETDAPFPVRDLGDRSISYTGDRAGIFDVLLGFDDRNGSSSSFKIEIKIIPHNIPPQISAPDTILSFVEEETTAAIEVLDENPGDTLDIWLKGSEDGVAWLDDEMVLHLLPGPENTGIIDIELFAADNNGSVVNTTITVTVKERNSPILGPDVIEIEMEAGDRKRFSFDYRDPDNRDLKLDDISSIPRWIDISLDGKLTLAISPTNDDIGRWYLPFTITDQKHDNKRVEMDLSVTEPTVPGLLIPREYVIREREKLVVDLVSDHGLNGSVGFEILTRPPRFMDIESDRITFKPRDGDSGRYRLRIRTFVAGGASSCSTHFITVERNLSTLEMKMNLYPNKGPYRPGDTIFIEMVPSGYNGPLEFEIELTADDQGISTHRETGIFMTIPQAERMNVEVRIRGEEGYVDSFTIELEGIHERDQEGSYRREIFWTMLSSAILATMLLGAVIIIKIKVRKGRDSAGSPIR